jgi:hypothetical protein
MAPGSGGGIGVMGSTTSSEPSKAGVVGINAGAGAGVAAINQSAAGANGFALWASSKATGVYAEGSPAAYFKVDIQVTGDLILINSPASGDIAEDFDVEDDPASAEPGTVLIINSSGKLCTSASPYDTRVAGVVSGAGKFRPAVVLQRIESGGRRSPVALLGKTFCKVDASFGSIIGGDLLTTSSTRGHAMKVRDRSQALGAILGKALTSLRNGRGLIPILVSLR